MVDSTLMVELSGELDLASAEALRDQLAAEVAATKPLSVVVDLGQVTFMDSTALSALIHVQHAAADAGAALRVVSPSPFVARLLHITGVAEALGYHAEADSPATLAEAYSTAADGRPNTR
nr:STAS domain-containing protein [Planosporangium thailandense]